MELFRALGALIEAPSAETARLARLLDLGEPPEPGEYERVFLFQLYPYASVYLGAEGQMGGEARDRIAGFWRALELTPPDEPDHLALMLGLYARLAELEGEASEDRVHDSWRLARKAWFWEHLASWLPVYTHKLLGIAGRLHHAWGELLLAVLAAEAGALGPPESQPLHLRDAPALSDPRRAGAAAFLRELLTPVRAGFILLDSDLRDAARELELGVRAGERRYVLENLLAQDARSTLDWLSSYADRAGRRHPTELASFEPVAGFWSSRARAAASLLGELALEAPSPRSDDQDFLP